MLDAVDIHRRAAQKPGCETDFSWEPIYDVAAAVELIHVASLIHDDVIDEAALRRGRPSVNAEWGNHAAVLAGDYLFATAFRLLDPHAASGMVTLMTHAIACDARGRDVAEGAGRPRRNGGGLPEADRREDRSPPRSLLRSGGEARRSGRTWRGASAPTAGSSGSHIRSPTTSSTSRARARRWASRQAPT